MFNLLQNIKADKEISLKSWRYRVLHWFWGVDGVEEKAPQVFYTHFCPLFHATNLIVILFPLIMLWKIFCSIISIIVLGVKWINNKLDNIKFPVLKSAVPELSSEDRQKLEESCMIKWFKSKKRYLEETLLTDQNAFLRCYSSNHVFGDELLIQVWENVRQKFLKSLVKYQEQEKLLRARIAFWVGFSQAFFKITLNILYVLLAVGVLYFGIPLAIKLGGLVGWLFMMCLNVNWLEVLSRLGLFSGGIGVGLGIVYVLIKNQWVFNKISGPIILGIEIFGVILSFVFRGIEKFLKFISVFYEENCPKITIVEEEI